MLTRRGGKRERHFFVLQNLKSTKNMTCPMHILELIIHATIKILLAKESFYRHLLCTMTHVVNVNRVLLISTIRFGFIRKNLNWWNTLSCACCGYQGRGLLVSWSVVWTAPLFGNITWSGGPEYKRCKCCDSCPFLLPLRIISIRTWYWYSPSHSLSR